MRFSTFFILACIVMCGVASCLQHSVMLTSASHHGRIVEDRVWRTSPEVVRIDRNSAWGDRSAPPQFNQPFFAQDRNARYMFPQTGMNDDAINYGRPGFDWSRFGMAVVLLTGGTLVCRRIFRGTAGPCRSVQRYQSLQSTRRVEQLSRMCPRPDCGRMNPPIAKFCRRCGAELRDV